MIYLAPNNAPKSEQHFGLLISLNSQRAIEKPVWAMDNGRFGAKGVNSNWTDDKWFKMLKKYQPYNATCKFCVVPDVPYNAKETLAIFPKYASVVRSFGYPVAICTQDGMTPADIDWEAIGAIFIGGSDEHKMGQEAISILLEAKRRDKWTHVGRVNGAVKIMQKLWFVDSVDGTTLAIEKSTTNIYKFQKAVSFCQGKKKTGRLL